MRELLRGHRLRIACASLALAAVLAAGARELAREPQGPLPLGEEARREMGREAARRREAARDERRRALEQLAKEFERRLGLLEAAVASPVPADADGRPLDASDRELQQLELERARKMMATIRAELDAARNPPGG